MKKLFLLFFLLAALVSAQESGSNRFEQNIMSQAAISVTIGGNFIITGTFPAGMNERVDQFVTRMYNSSRDKILTTAQSDQKRLLQIKQEFEKYSFRNIILKRIDGSQVKIDLVKFRMTGDFKYNPYLRNDDVIIFEPINLETQFFTVSGAAVNNPGKFPFVEGDNLADAIALAGGFNKSFEVKSADIIRLNADGNRTSTLNVSIEKDLPLKQGDRIVINTPENFRKEYSVTVNGEVKRPGVIPIGKNGIELKELINIAGGFTEYASLKKARIYTGNSVKYLYGKDFENRQQEYSELMNTDLNSRIMKLEDMMMLRMSNATVEDSSYLLMENQIRLMTEGASIDFSQVDDRNSDASKYIVKDGDVVVVPQKTNTVYVFGQVAHPGHIIYSPGQDYKYYVTKAGGLGPYAIGDEVMLIQGAQRSWVSADDPNFKLQEGDYIYVPRTVNKTFYQYVLQASTYVGIIGGIATVVLLMYQLTK